MIALDILFAFLSFVFALLWLLTQFSFGHKKLAGIGACVITVWLAIIGYMSERIIGVAFSGNLPAGGESKFEVVILAWRILIYGILPSLIALGVFYKRYERKNE